MTEKKTFIIEKKHDEKQLIRALIEYNLYFEAGLAKLGMIIICT